VKPIITVVTPTTGDKFVYDAIASVAKQTIPVNHLVVVDGYKYKLEPHLLAELHHDNLHVVYLPFNTGKVDGKVYYYGHRVYASMSFVIDTPFMSFLDEDNLLQRNWAEKMLDTMSQADYDAVTCRRNVLYQDGSLLGKDTFESVDGSFFDTNTFLWRTKSFANKYASKFGYEPWGFDRYLSHALMDSGKYKHIEEYLVDYRSPERLYEFFKHYSK